MNKIFNTLCCSFFIFVYAFTNDMWATIVQETQTQNDAYQQLLHCSFEDKLLAASSLAKDISDYDEDSQVGDFSKDVMDALTAAKNNKFALLMQKLSPEEKLKIFSHWIFEEIMHPCDCVITKEFLLMFTCKDGSLSLDAFMGGKDEEESNRYLDPTYYDVLSEKIKRSPNFEKLRFLAMLCYVPWFYIIIEGTILGMCTTYDLYDLSLNEFLQLLTCIDSSLNFKKNDINLDLMRYYFKNKLRPEDVNNQNIVSLSKNFESDIISDMNDKDQFNSNEHLSQEFKKQSSLKQLRIITNYFYLAAYLRLVALYSHEIETL